MFASRNKPYYSAFPGKEKNIFFKNISKSNKKKKDNDCDDEENEEKKIPCEVYSRVVGYYRPVQYWNTGKKQEFKERKFFDTALNFEK